MKSQFDAILSVVCLFILVFFVSLIGGEKEAVAAMTSRGSATAGNSGTDGIIYNAEPCTVPPVADFAADSTVVYVDDVVRFADLSTNDPTGWFWDFGGVVTVCPGYVDDQDDGDITNDQNPCVRYMDSGASYTVSLTATNECGSGLEESKTDYITVIPSPPSCYLPDSIRINEGEPFPQFDLDDYVEDPDTPPEALKWDVSDPGPETFDIDIDEETHVVTISNVYPAWLDKDECPEFRVEDPDGNVCVAVVCFRVIPATPPPCSGPRGDINSDGFINTGDAILALRIAVGLEIGDPPHEAGRCELSRGNVNCDGENNTGDAILILRYAVGLITEFPCGT